MTPAEQEIQNVILMQSFKTQLFRVAFMRKLHSGTRALQCAENELNRLWVQVRPNLNEKTRSAMAYVVATTPYDVCMAYARRGALPRQFVQGFNTMKALLWALVVTGYKLFNRLSGQ